MYRISLPLLLAASLSVVSTGCSRMPQWLSKYGGGSGGALSSLTEQDQAELARLEERDRELPATAAGQADRGFRTAGFTEAVADARTVTDESSLPSEEVITTLPAGASLTDQLAESEDLVLLDFYADWCGPCRRQAAVLHDVEGIARQYNARIIKVNVEQHGDLADRYRVQGLPTLIAVKGGREVDRLVGLKDAAQLADVLRM